MDPKTISAALSGLPVAVAIVLLLVGSLVYLLRLFAAPVSAWLNALATAEVEKAKVHSATLQVLSSKVDSVTPAVVAAVEADGSKTRAAVNELSGDFSEELTQGLGALRSSLPTVCPVPAASRPPSCPVTPVSGTAIPVQPAVSTGKASS